MKPWHRALISMSLWCVYLFNIKMHPSILFNKANFHTHSYSFLWSICSHSKSYSTYICHAVNIKWLDGSDLMFVQKRMRNQCRPRWQRAFSARGMCFHAEAAGCTNTSNFMTKASSSLVSWTGRVLGWDMDSGMINNCTVEPLSLTFFAPSVLNSLPASLWNLPVLSGFKAQSDEDFPIDYWQAFPQT